MRKVSFFVGYFQTFSDKPATILNSTSLAGYPVHVVLRNSSAKYLRCLIEKGNTVECFMLVTVGSYLKGSSSIHQGWSSTYSIKGTDEVGAGKHVAYTHT